MKLILRTNFCENNMRRERVLSRSRRW